MNSLFCGGACLVWCSSAHGFVFLHIEPFCVVLLAQTVSVDLWFLDQVPNFEIHFPRHFPLEDPYPVAPTHTKDIVALSCLGGAGYLCGFFPPGSSSPVRKDAACSGDHGYIAVHSCAFVQTLTTITKPTAIPSKTKS